MAALPDEAGLAVSRIEALLDEAKRLIERTGATDESAFSLQETERRYLPDTLNAYLNVPPSQRNSVADALLIDQLRLLERATAARLALLAETGRSNLAANGAFLAERFGPAESLPEISRPGASDTHVVPLSAPRALVTRLFSDFAGAGRTDPAQVLQLAGQRFAAVFPALTTVRRGLFGGPVKSVALDVPRSADVLRYTLEAERGSVAATCTKIVRGVALRTERIDLGAWMHGLLEDMSAYVERDRAARDLLTTFLAG
jgi:hypothetical protein